MELEADDKRRRDLYAFALHDPATFLDACCDAFDGAYGTEAYAALKAAQAMVRDLDSNQAQTTHEQAIARHLSTLISQYAERHA